MASTVKYFSETTELTKGIWPQKNAAFQLAFPGVKGKRYDSFSKIVGKTDAGEILPVTRIIEYKNHPSLHQCGARCLSAKGRSCECSCGGKNHGVQS